MNPYWRMSHGLGWSCHACGSFTADGAGISDIERDCLNKVCWSLRAAANETDSECAVMPPLSKTLMEVTEELRMGREYKIASKQDKRPLVDTEAFSLAEYFLSDHPDATEDTKWELAKVIQDAVEGWFEHGCALK